MLRETQIVPGAMVSTAPVVAFVTAFFLVAVIILLLILIKILLENTVSPIIIKKMPD